MIGWPKTEAEHAWLRGFLLSRGAGSVTPEAHMITWMKGGTPQWVAAFDQWCGKTCQVHWASAGVSFLPREFLYFTLTYGFSQLGLKRLFGQVKSTNRASLGLVQRVGFREIYRAEGCHDNGEDIIFIELRADECKWIRKTDGQKLSTCP